MLSCVYHPIDEMRVVEDSEAEKLIASGLWFDSPAKAKAYREEVEKEINTKPKVKKGKVKQEIDDEKR